MAQRTSHLLIISLRPGVYLCKYSKHLTTTRTNDPSYTIETIICTHIKQIFSMLASTFCWEWLRISTSLTPSLTQVKELSEKLSPSHQHGTYSTRVHPWLAKLLPLFMEGLCGQLSELSFGLHLARYGRGLTSFALQEQPSVTQREEFLGLKHSHSTIPAFPLDFERLGPTGSPSLFKRTPPPGEYFHKTGVFLDKLHR